MRKIKKTKLIDVIEEAMKRGENNKLSRGEIARQRVSFAFGNSGMEHNDFTRETVAVVSDEIDKVLKDAD